MKRYDLTLISKNRPAVFTLSVLWIAFFHSTLAFDSTFVMNLKNWGSCGVDVFLLVSGISLYFSMQKNGADILGFYRRRMLRVLLPSLIVSILWFGYKDLIAGKNILLFVSDMTGVTLFTRGKKAVWFVVAIVIDYLLYPFIYRFFEKMKWSLPSFLLLLSAAFSVNLALKLTFREIYENSEILWRRLPVFVTGCFMGKAVYEKKTLPVNGWVILAATVLLTGISFLIPFRDIGHLRYLFLPLAIGYTMLFSLAGEWEPVAKISAFFAPISLEIYLLHEKTLEILPKFLPGMGNGLINLTGFLIAVIGAYALLLIEKRILKKK